MRPELNIKKGSVVTFKTLEQCISEGVILGESHLINGDIRTHYRFSSVLMNPGLNPYMVKLLGKEYTIEEQYIHTFRAGSWAWPYEVILNYKKLKLIKIL